MDQKIGPVQLVAIGFTRTQSSRAGSWTSSIRLESHETIRILDLLFVGKDAETGRSPRPRLPGRRFGRDRRRATGLRVRGRRRATDGSSEGSRATLSGSLRSEIQDIAASLDPGNSAGFLLIEHVWARDLKAAIRDAGGFPLGEGFLTPETLAEVATELVAMSEALEELETEEAGAGA